MNPATRLFYLQYKHPWLRVLTSKIMRVLFSCDVTTVQGGNTLKHNELGVVISRMVTLGSNCKIYQGVTIGAGKGGYPIIGDNVTIYSNSTVCGKIKIGNNVIIGANSFVNTDIPDNAVYAGVPARFIKNIVDQG